MRKAKAVATGAWGRPDPWGPRLYSFEDDWDSWGKATLTLAECRAVANAACSAFNLKPVSVRQHESRAMSFCHIDDSDPPEFFISMRLDHKNVPMVLHEVSHYITDRMYGLKKTQDHGPTFQGIYFWLLARAGVAPREALAASAQRRGLRWRERGPR